MVNQEVEESARLFAACNEKRTVLIDIESDNTVNYASHQNNIPVIRLIRVTNEGQIPLNDLTLHINTEPPFGHLDDIFITRISPGETYNLHTINLVLSHQYLSRLEERVIGSIVAELSTKGSKIAETTRAISILSHDEWNGLQSLPEIIAAFVTPNNPVIETILSHASKILENYTGDSSVAGYHYKNRSRVYAITSSIYSAVADLHIRYAHPPASFEEHGQKIRLPDRIIKHRLANCMDLTILFSALLEQAGFHPLIIIFEGHTYAGVWLDEECFPDVATDDLLPLRKRVELQEILVFAPKEATSDTPTSFNSAVEVGVASLNDNTRFRTVIDIFRARKGKNRIVPISLAGEERDELPDKSDLSTNLLLDHTHDTAWNPLQIPEPDTDPLGSQKLDIAEKKLEKWKNNLLDLSLRNRLLNFNETKQSLQIHAPDIVTLERALAGGDRFQILPGISADDIDKKEDSYLGTKNVSFLSTELHHHRLYTPYIEKELQERLINIHKTAKNSIDENGASTFYIALGFLHWYESEESDRQLCAPIILIPLMIERRSFQEGFRIKVSDDEPRINITLLHRLSHDFGIDIPGLDPLPDEYPGIDIQMVLSRFRLAMRDISRWEVVELAYLAHFSFSKFLMWRDLEIRSEFLLKHPLVARLADPDRDPDSGSISFPETSTLDNRYHPSEIFCPMSADSSQLAAVIAAGQGKTFVLYGPPGTGKSQTIANSIAHCLAHGRTVLFVSEKRVALDVVHQRLKSCGLGPYCLELHSNKSHKKEVISQLEEALTITDGMSLQEWQTRTDELCRIRTRLNEYVNAIHATDETGESFYYCLSHLIQLRNTPHIPIQWETEGGGETKTLHQIREVVHRLQIALDQCGDLTVHPWTKINGDKVWSIQWRNSVECALQEMKASCQAVQKLFTSIAPLIGADPTNGSLSGLIALDQLITRLLHSHPIVAKILGHPDSQTLHDRLVKMVKTAHERDHLKSRVFSRYSPDILNLDLKFLKEQVSQANSAWFGRRILILRDVEKQLSRVTRPGYILKSERIEEDINRALLLTSREQMISAFFAEHSELLDKFTTRSDIPWDRLNQILIESEDLTFLAGSFEKGSTEIPIIPGSISKLWAEIIRSQANQSGDGSISTPLSAYAPALKDFLAKKNFLISILGFDPETIWGSEAESSYLSTIKKQTDIWLSSLPRLREWLYLKNARMEGCIHNLEAIIEYYENHPSGSDSLQDLCARSYYQWRVDSIRDKNPVIKDFYRPAHEDDIARFIRLDEQYLALTRETVRVNLDKAIPRGIGSTQNSELGILRRQIALQRRHLPVRTLFKKIPSILPHLKPCMLMSPISVAQYLDPIFAQFDLVIFDEASQIPVWDAVGAIARGAQTMIVGDPKQLPPTNLFQRVDVGEEDEEDEYFMDLESVLDDCIAARIPSMHLNWHYRSRHESLIAFSNYHFYENRLLTFPSIHQESAVSIRMVDGIFDRGRTRTNKKEAEAVVSEIIHRLKNPSTALNSIGIVTFNERQQDLIISLLEKARQNHPDIEHFFSEERPDSLFVKNLENIQGDERDIILFSVGYGPDIHGRISLNFGPLNRDGGERRLNVAITRARKEIVLFSSLRPEQIDLTRTQKTGVRLLKSFLDYAARGDAAIAEACSPGGSACDSPFEEAVKEELENKGYIVHAQVGCGGYRIDLGIVDPDNMGRYLIGIECDGATYHRAKTARDRDHLRQEILTGLGWTIHRIWSTDWWDDPVTELNRVITAINMAKEKNMIIAESSALFLGDNEDQTGDAPCPEPEELLNLTIPLSYPDLRYETIVNHQYQVYINKVEIGTKEEFNLSTDESRIISVITDIVMLEAPIRIDTLTRRIITLWGIQKAGSAIQCRIDLLLNYAGVLRTQEDDAVFIWQPGMGPESYTSFRTHVQVDAWRRKIEEISVYEIQNAAIFVVQNEGMIPLSDLIKEVAYLFGMKRSGPKIETRINRGILLALDSGVLLQDDVMIRLGES
ncbi:MAG TPA: DUF3320 domain-containing protein [Methanospirillum sp.]|nr:DUF3320 domain-containing protein [Methanospirillum sp.]